MSAKVQLDEALELALKLSAKERVQLIERLASSVEREIADGEAGEGQPPAPEKTLKTGAELVAMLEQMDAIAFVDPEITDPTEWVQTQRRKEADRLKPYWDGEK